MIFRARGPSPFVVTASGGPAPVPAPPPPLPSLSELVAALDGLGVRLSIRLVIDAPAGAITPNLRDALAEHKPALLVALAREAQWEAVRGERRGPAVGDPTPGIVIKTPSARPTPEPERGPD